MRKSIRKGDRIKLIDSDLSGVFVSDNADGSVNIETDEGLIIPVNLSQLLISDSIALHNLEHATGRGKKSKDALTGTAKIKSIPAKREKVPDERYIAVVDLHMKIIPAAKSGTTSSDILERQLSKFTQALKRAVTEHKKELIVIHGEGSGKLKEEVRRLSKTLYPQYLIMDAPLHKYGSGASKILIK